MKISYMNRYILKKKIAGDIWTYHRKMLAGFSITSRSESDALVFNSAAKIRKYRTENALHGFLVVKLPEERDSVLVRPVS